MSDDGRARWNCERCGASGAAVAKHPLMPEPAGVFAAIRWCWLVHQNTCPQQAK